MNIRPILLRVIILTTAGIGWLVSPLFYTDLHVMNLAGKLCPCSFEELEKRADGSCCLRVRDGAGELIWVSPATLTEGALSIEAYVLPWFGRKAVRIQADGSAIVPAAE